MADESGLQDQGPTFKGRLQLDSFAYAPASPLTPPLRSSPRLHALPKSTIANAKPKATPSPLKRKASAPLDDRASKRSFPVHQSPSRQPTPKLSLSSLSSPSPSSQNLTKRNLPSSYAPPSTYAHLPLLPDALAPNLHILFVGLNPGIQTAVTGHTYAHPSNLFWKLLHSSRITPTATPCKATEDRSMPARFKLGFTNIVARPSRNGAELSKAEMDDGVAVLEQKVRRWRPEVVCIVGKSIWESVWRVRRGRGIRKDEFRYAWQDVEENMGRIALGSEKEDEEPGVEYREDWSGARVFVATSTSGLAATLSPAEKQAVWQQLGDWVVQRRKKDEVVNASI